MEKARCTQDNAIYNADQFAGLPTDDLSNLRHHLVCPECGGRAFFRRETQNDRDPCFGARPHAPWCGLKTAQANAGAVASADSLDPNKRIVVDFAFETSASTLRAADSAHADSTEMEGEFSGDDGHDRFSDRSVRHMRLGPLLNTLMNKPEFRTSQQILEIGRRRFRVCDFFVELKAITAAHVGAVIGAYGRIERVQWNQKFKCVWLITTGFDTPNILVPEDLFISLLYRFGLRQVENFTGANVLVIASVRPSNSGVPYVHLQDPSHIAADFSWLR